MNMAKSIIEATLYCLPNAETYNIFIVIFNNIFN